MLTWVLMLQSAVLAAGQPVEVREAEGNWAPGTITGVTRKEDGTLEYHVQHKVGNFTMEHYFPADRVRASGGAGADGPLYTLDQRVEVKDHGSDTWRPAKVNRIEGSPGYWRYNVVFIGGNKGESEFYKDRVRLPQGATAATGGTPKGGALALGTYACTRWLAPGQTQPPVGSITLMANGTYRWLDNGGTGRFSYDAASGAMRFLTGPIAAKQPKAVTYQRNRTTSQIDLNFAYGVDWSCGKNL